jgi:MGT family glycosyltransferase
MLAIAQHLKNSGHQVTFNNAEPFREQVESAGLRFVPMTGKANLDYRRPDDIFPERKDLAPGPDFKNLQLRYWFADPLPDQYRGILRIMADTPVDLILTGTMFFGAFPMLLGPRETRPPIISCGVNPLMLSSIDCTLTSPPDTTPEGRRRNKKEQHQVHVDFQPATDCFNWSLYTCGAPPLPHFFLDCLYLLPDLFLQCTTELFEFPRSDMPETIQFVGAVPAKLSARFKEPAWWKELDGSKPVILVTQGTIANTDLTELIQPTLSALAGEDVLLIAATGRPDIKTMAAPANARVEPFVPFDRLLPKVDVLVTNGGYGTVHQAFSHGVPIVIAGETEDKAIVAARVAWSGAGISLDTRSPTQEQIRTAVRTVLADKQYRYQARKLQDSLSQYNALDGIANAVDSVLAQEANRVMVGTH